MIEFFKKNQKNITMAAALSLLLICYFQQKELAKLRKSVMTIQEINLNNTTTDSLLKLKSLK